MKIVELQQKRAKAVADARAILDKAEGEKRALSAEEKTSYDKAFAESDALKADIEREERQAAAEAELASSQRRAGPQSGDRATPSDKPEVRTIELTPSCVGEQRSIRVVQDQATIDHVAAFRHFLTTGEKRALQKDSGSAGGYLSAPMEFMGELIQGLDNAIFVRQRARVLPPLGTADSLGVPSLDADPADPTWTGELLIGNEDSTMAFGRRELKPAPSAQYLKVSKTLIRRSALSADAIVRDRLVFKQSAVMENAYLNGAGTTEPLGVFTASANGINTDRDVATGNTATSITADGLQEAKYHLKGQYRNRARWCFHRDGVKQISKLKDGEGRYLWQPSVQAGQADMLLGLPVDESEYAPAVFSANRYVGILGDWQYYWILDALTITIEVLVELAAATNQVIYLSRYEGDGMPVLSAAFSRVKLGA